MHRTDPRHPTLQEEIADIGAHDHQQDHE